MSPIAYRTSYTDLKRGVTSPHQQQQQDEESNKEPVLSKPGAYSIRQISTDGEDNDEETTCSYGVCSETSVAGRSVISAPWALVLQSRTVSITPVPLVEAYLDGEEAMSTNGNVVAEVARQNKKQKSAGSALSRARKSIKRFFRPFSSWKQSAT